MGVECGIVGLPNVGKSTLFNTLTSSGVPAENFPFCTVDPHRGIVTVPDHRLQQLREIVNPERVVPATVTFVDIAGLVKGASAGEGLGNQFLSHIREVNAITHVVRCFEDDNIIHVMGGVDPKRDIEIIELELCLSDLELVEKRLEKVEKQGKAGHAESKIESEWLRASLDKLKEGIPFRRQAAPPSGVSTLQYVTSKPLLYVANISEADVKSPSAKLKGWLQEIEKIAALDGARVLPLCINLENQLRELSEEDRQPFYEEYGIKEPGLHRLIRDAYSLLGLMTYFTAGEKEVRAWTVRTGAKGPEAAGAIHSDFEKGFIRAEVISFADYMGCRGEKGAKERGLMRSEGKEYVVRDGDVILFRFAV